MFFLNSVVYSSPVGAKYHSSAASNWLASIGFKVGLPPVEALNPANLACWPAPPAVHDVPITMYELSWLMVGRVIALDAARRSCRSSVSLKRRLRLGSRL